MKLEYKVLWFEDQKGEVEGDWKRLEQFVKGLGFEPNFEHKDKITMSEIEELSDKLASYNPYDLVVFDYDLGAQSENGLNIAKHFRSRIFTDMVFYSGRVPEDLRQLLFDEKVDGIFIVHRDFFYDDIEPIVEDHIKKISDINNMRGVVMSETSRMDIALREILIDKSKKLTTDELTSNFEKLKKRLNEKLDTNKKKIGKLESFEEAISDHMMTTFDNVRVALKDIVEESQKNTLDNDSLLHNLQKERNKLAHQKDELTDDGRMLLHGKGDSVEYNYETFKELRKNLLKTHSSIQELNK